MRYLPMAGTGRRAMENFANCGADCVIEYCTEEKRYRLRASYCHCRHCEPCMKAKASLLAANLKEKLEENAPWRYRFITLTLRSTPTPLTDQIKRLYQSYKKLRATKLWKNSQTGGAAMLEVKWHAATRTWHPHLHIVSEGTYLNSRDLSQTWHEITGDSYIVDIRRLQHAKDAAFYVAKYVSKGTNNEVWDDQQAAIEWICAMRGVRTAATFGKWRGYKLLKKPEQKGVWKAVDLLRHVCSRARQGDEIAIRFLEGLRESFQYDPHKQRRSHKQE
jgi:hypothetical protein